MYPQIISEERSWVISVVIWVLASVPQFTPFFGINPMHYDPNRFVCIAGTIIETVQHIFTTLLSFWVGPITNLTPSKLLKFNFQRYRFVTTNMQVFLLTPRRSEEEA